MNEGRGQRCCDCDCGSDSENVNVADEYMEMMMKFNDAKHWTINKQNISNEM